MVEMGGILTNSIKMQVKHGVGVDDIVNHVLNAWETATGKKKRH